MVPGRVLGRFETGMKSEGRLVGPKVMIGSFVQAEREIKCERRIWRIEWRLRFRKPHRRIEWGRKTEETEAGNIDTDIGMEVHSTVRENHGQGRDEERVMWSHEDLRMSAYSEVNIDAWVEPMEGKRGTERDGTPRCSGRGDGRTKGGTHAVRGTRIRRAIGMTGGPIGEHTWQTKSG